jgi:hypothetical protein
MFVKPNVHIVEPVFRGHCVRQLPPNYSHLV